MMRLCVKPNNVAEIFFFSLLTFAFLAGSAFAEDMKALKKDATLDEVLQTIEQPARFPHGIERTWPANKNMGGDDAGPGEINAYFGDGPRSLGFDQRGTVSPGPAVGMTMGLTTYDYQHNSRCTRQIGWRGTNDIHVAWMKKNNSYPVIGAGVRITTYQLWNSTNGQLAFDAYTNFGGDDLHASGERSGYCGVDVFSDGRGMPYNHYDPDGWPPYNYYPVIWPDQSVGAGHWGYKQEVPEDMRIEDWAKGGGNWVWPYATFQIYDNGDGLDTIIHIVASESGSISNLVHRYFRRSGAGPHPQSPGITWSSMTFDSGQTITTVVEAAPPNVASGFEGKVALVWCAYFGASFPGDYESGHLEPISLLLEQNAQDVYMMTSDDAGETWNGKYNVTKNDILTGGWWPLGDINAVIDTEGRLHIVWAARQQVNLTGEYGSVTDPQMYYPMYPLGSRILHWSDEGETDYSLDDNYITIVKDAMHDFSEMDSICIGGAWHGMALNLPQIGQCDDKLYVTFAQFQDVANGVWDNCHISAWTQNQYIGSANANLYFSVSTMWNGGLNWDPARLLTGFTPRCDTANVNIDPNDPIDPSAESVCHSHFWHSMSRWGMDVSGGGDFVNAVVVTDPTWTQYGSPGYYMDVFYIDDLWPGGLVQGEGMWTVNPVKWFRLPCVDYVERSNLVIEPAGIYHSATSWSKPGVMKTVTLKMINNGNATLNFPTLPFTTEIDNADPSYNGWLSIDWWYFPGHIYPVVPGNTWDIGVVINTDWTSPAYPGWPDGIGEITETAVLKGTVTFYPGSGQEVVLPIEWIIADTLQLIEQDTIFTQHIGLTVSNNGNYGGGLYDTCGRMDFHILGNLGIECDTCEVGVGNVQYKYLAEASPFVVRDIGGGVARISTSVAGHNPFSEAVTSDLEIRGDFVEQPKDGFRPQEGQWGEHNNVPFCNWVESGLFCTADSAIGVINQVIAPMTSPDTSDFFVLVTKYFNLTDAAIENMFVGTIEDWDIPSDSGSRNTSGFDVDRKLMYMQGWEAFQPDTFCDNSLNGNDCNFSDRRFGGSAFFGGLKKKIKVADNSITGIDKYEEAQGSFTFKRPNWMGVDVRSHIPAQRLYDTLSGIFYGYSPWHSILEEPVEDQDSLYQDLAMITSFGSYSLGVKDTLTFIKFIASEYQGGLPGIQETIDQARAFTLHYLCCDIWGIPGDADTDGKINILDVVYIINFKYKEGHGVRWPSSTYDPEGDDGWPTDNCDAIMDCNGNSGINILDVVYLINYKYKGGPEPTCRYSWIQ